MRAALGLPLALLLAGIVRAEAPVAWSPDGAWIAYVQATRPVDRAVERGWFLRPAPARPAPADDAGLTYRLWSVRVADGVSSLIAESSLPLSSAGWHPEGRALAYGGLTRDESGGGWWYETVVHDGVQGRRVLTRSAVAELSPELAKSIAGARVAWSPDGRFLALPVPAGLAIMRAEDGHQLKVVPGAFAPSWAPEGRGLAFYRRGDPEALWWMDGNLGEPRRLTSVPGAGTHSAPVWSPDGQDVYVIREGASLRGASRADLVRVRVARGDVRDVRSLVHEPRQAPGRLLGATFTLERGGLDLFYATNIAGQPTQITWCQLPRNMNYSRFNPVDFSTPVSALALAPHGGKLALRVGPADAEGPVAIVAPDPHRFQFDPLMPDAESRAAWLAVMIDATLEALRVPPPQHEGSTVERPTPLPTVFELEDPVWERSRLQHLARVSRPCWDVPTRSDAPSEQALERVLEEARFVYTYLSVPEREPGATLIEALRSLERLEGRTSDPAEREALTTLRIQIDQGLGETSRARVTIERLRRTLPAEMWDVEETPQGPVLKERPDGRRLWLAWIEAKLDAPVSTAEEDETEAIPGLRSRLQRREDPPPRGGRFGRRRPGFN